MSQPFDQSKYHSNSSLKLPPKANAYFQALEALIDNPKKSVPSNTLPSGMLLAWKKLSKKEKVKYIRENLKYLESIIEGNGNERYQLISKPSKIESQCEKNSMLCFYKPYMSFKLETGARTILLNEDDNIRMIDLQNYLVHEEKSLLKKSIVLEPIVKASNPWDTISREEFFLPSEQYAFVYEQLFNCIMDIRNEELTSLINSEAEIKKVENEKLNLFANKIINKEKYEEFKKFKKHILENESVSYKSYENLIYEEENADSYFSINQNMTNQNLFKLQIKSHLDCYDLKQSCLSTIFTEKNPLIIESELMDEYAPTCVAILEKYYLKETAQTALYMREILSVTDMLMLNSINSIISIEDKKRHQDFMFWKSVDNPFVNSFFKYLCGFVKSSTNDKKYKSSLILIGEFNLGKGLTEEMVVEFLSEFDYAMFDITEKLMISPSKFIKKESLKTTNKVIHERIVEAIDKVDDGPKSKMDIDQDEKRLSYDFEEPEKKITRNQFIEVEQAKRQSKIPTFYRHRFDLEPIKNFDVKGNLVKENFMKGEWKRGKEGGMICINEKVITEQKKIFKHILSSLGSNLLKGVNILNVSLPVTIFKKEGHLQMIADSFSIAPRLFENCTDPLERVKNAVIISVAVGTLGLSVEKPFFPTLGETLQVWIGGCPMYMEQILRYPPTTSYILYGRGYRIQGQVEPKVSIGLNNGKGYSERPSHIIFDDGQTIELSYSKMIINGIVMGEREFNFYDKNFAYDKKNNLFAELIFGARDTQLFKKDLQEKDFLYGKIYKLSSDFVSKFDKEPAPKPFPTKKYIESVVSSFEGYWDGAISFDGKQYIDFLKDLPSKVETEEYALPSDTKFRSDLIRLIEDNIEEAQKEKAVVEEGQRRDRKLREERSNKKK